MSEGNDYADFSDAFCAFLQSCVTSVNAAELLLALWRNSSSARSVGELVSQLDSSGVLSEAEVTACIETFKARGLVAHMGDGKVFYRSSADFDMHLQMLARLYLERPVTLFRVIYALRDSKIKTLADAFRIWRR